MKYSISLIFFLFYTATYAFDSSFVKKRIIGTFHTKNIHITGLSFGFASTMADQRSVHTNGLRIELPGIGMISFMGNGFPNAKSPFSLEGHKFSEVVKGLNVSTGSWCNCNYDGLTIALVGQFGVLGNGLAIAGGWNLIDKHNGVQLAAISNTAYYLKGIQISGFNFATEATGLQVGVINKAKNFKGVQIGLWNENHKRKLPIINWSVRKEE